MIENRESDERACCVLSLSLSFIKNEDTCVSLSPLVRTKTRSNEQTNRSFRFFFASLLRSFIARTQHVSHKHTHTHTHIVRLWFRKENRITIGILTIVV